MSDLILYTAEDGLVKLKVTLENESVWLSQEQMAILFGKAKSTISEHIKHIFEEGELQRDSVVRKFRTTASDGKNYQVEHYNLDVIISVGYRVKSKQGVHFRQWATARLKEYIIKGFTLDDERLKNLSGGNYWQELLDRIRDIRSSEKVMYRQVLDLYATAIDYDPKNNASVEFFKIVQNKLHYAAHGHTASEVIYFRVDSAKPFAGLTNFKGEHPTQAETMIAKNYLTEKELKVLNNLVAAYFDLAELNAIEEREMRMKDHLQALDNILSTTGRAVLNNAGKITSEQAKQKATEEYRKYKAKTLSDVEKDYLKTIKQIEQLGKWTNKKRKRNG